MVCNLGFHLNDKPAYAPGERFSKLADAEVTEMVEIVVDDDTFV